MPSVLLYRAPRVIGSTSRTCLASKVQKPWPYRGSGRRLSQKMPSGSCNSLPRCVIPFRFTCSYSERCVRRRVFGKENEPADAILTGILYRAPLNLKISRFKSTLRAVGPGCATSVQKKSSTGIRGKTSRRKESLKFIARAATQQVFPLCQPAIQFQWWQLELPL